MKQPVSLIKLAKWSWINYLAIKLKLNQTSIIPICLNSELIESLFN